jgi:hypothetical protein
MSGKRPAEGSSTRKKANRYCQANFSPHHRASATNCMATLAGKPLVSHGMTLRWMSGQKVRPTTTTTILTISVVGKTVCLPLFSV